MKNKDKEIFEMRCNERDTFTKSLYPVIVDVIEERGGFVLQRSTDNHTNSVKYRLFWDGECVSTLTNEREARSLLDDFAPVPKKRGRKPKAA